jgi:hypothetical protein
MLDDQQLHKFTETPEGPDIEYRYIAHVRAIETFANVMDRLGISLPDKSSHVSFTSPKRLNMKIYRENKLIWSYSIIRVRKEEEVIEELIEG